MFFVALAADYDGTLAHDGVVDAATTHALEDFKKTGRRLLLVTGREVIHLKAVFPHTGLFDMIVAENGAVLYDPATGQEEAIAAAPPPVFVEALRRHRVEPLSVGKSIVATWEPNEQIVLKTIHELGLELQIIFNKGAVMVLPPGVNKASGLMAALKKLDLSPHNVVGVGDAENDHAFLAACGCAVAVANALPMVKKAADVVTAAARGAGVVELMARLRDEDAAIVAPERHGIVLGTDDQEMVYLEPHGGSVLIAGSSGAGKSTVAAALCERMREKTYQFCIFDPEGDYSELDGAVPVGDAEVIPAHDEVVELLRNVETDVVVNTLALGIAERPGFFAKLLPDALALRARAGHPHWLFLDEAHHLLPAERLDLGVTIPKGLSGVLFITVHPEALSRDALSVVDKIVAVGPKAWDAIAGFGKATGIETPTPSRAPQQDEVLFWRLGSGESPRIVKVEGPRQVRTRHTRKYAEGKLGTDKSFYFRGPEGALHLRAQNLTLFLQLAEGVDDKTWEHHLRAGDYSKWFREAIKDDELAREAAGIEADRSLDPGDSRKRIADAVQRRYTAPARQG